MAEFVAEHLGEGEASLVEASQIVHCLCGGLVHYRPDDPMIAMPDDEFVDTRALQLDDVQRAIGSAERNVSLVKHGKVPSLGNTNVAAAACHHTAEDPVGTADQVLDLSLGAVGVIDQSVQLGDEFTAPFQDGRALRDK